MTFARYEPITYEARPAVYLWPIWRERYARIRFTDTNERRTVAVMDIKPLAQACVDAVRDAFDKLDARLAAIDAWDPLDSDEPRP